MSSLSASQGAAAPVLFVHGSLSSVRMWAPFSRLFGPSRRILMPDLSGYGSSPVSSGFLHLHDEARNLLASFDGPADVVAHSYGAAVALRLLVDAPHRVRTLVLVEPACFCLLPDLGPRGAADRREIATLRHDIQERFERHGPSAAASRFIDFWNGPGAFSAMPDERQRGLASRVGKVIGDFEAIASGRITLSMLRRLAVPTLVVNGDRGPKAPRTIGDAIARVMPRGSGIRIAGAGHMLPMSHGAELAQALSRWFGTEANTPLARAA
jgi:pimeloyl-ACP methyl ester carboxylesterase